MVEGVRWNMMRVPGDCGAAGRRAPWPDGNGPAYCNGYSAREENTVGGGPARPRRKCPCRLAGTAWFQKSRRFFFTCDLSFSTTRERLKARGISFAFPPGAA